MIDLCVRRLCAATVLIGLAMLPAAAQDFPFDQEMLLDAKRLPDSRRVPLLEVRSGGRATLDMWCHNAVVQFDFTGAEVKLTFVSAQPQNCTPERIELDQQMAKALLEVTSWRRERDIVTLVGPTAFRFRLSTH